MRQLFCPAPPAMYSTSGLLANSCDSVGCGRSQDRGLLSAHREHRRVLVIRQNLVRRLQLRTLQQRRHRHETDGSSTVSARLAATVLFNLTPYFSKNLPSTLELMSRRGLHSAKKEPWDGMVIRWRGKQRGKLRRGLSAAQLYTARILQCGHTPLRLSGAVGSANAQPMRAHCAHVRGWKRKRCLRESGDHHQLSGRCSFLAAPKAGRDREPRCSIL
eukprot:363221-Chlamydomonas_euryale.AAC.7